MSVRMTMSEKKDLRKAFAEAGFEVIELDKNPEAIELRKYGCARRLERTREGTWTPVGPPYFRIRGVNYELEDRGYQKFWYANGKRIPIRQADLKNLHHFDEEVRALLALKSLYHESLGTTSARSAYDRLSGRPDSL